MSGAGSRAASGRISGATVAVGDVAVQVQAAPGLREEILATVHRIEVDANGCPVRDEVTANPGLRPSPAVGLEDLTGVRSVAACVYDLDMGDLKIRARWIEGPSLSSSIRMTGAAATAALAGLAGAPAAGGQDRPEGCLYKYGGTMLVLLVDSAAGPSRIHIRYAGCDHNAVDDGVSPRRLTAAVRPFVSGGNRPGGMTGGRGKLEAFFDAGLDGKVPPPTAPPS